MRGDASDPSASSDASGLALRLQAIRRAISGRILFTTSFGIEDQLIAHHIFAQSIGIEVVTLDTGRLFDATYRLWQQTEERYGIRIRALYPDAGQLSELVADQGINGFYHSKEARLSCCGVRKVEPLKRALDGAAAWITGLRADQSGQRSDVRFESFDEDHGLTKFAPLFDRSRADILSECIALGVPINELHSRGYPSIGCEPCTRAVEPGQLERSGRWWWEDGGVGECGLHLSPSGRGRAVQ